MDVQLSEGETSKIIVNNVQMEKQIDIISNSINKNMSDISHLSTDQIPIISKIVSSSNECCVWCKKSSDSPNHIRCLQNIDQKNILLKLEPMININPCFCDQCFKLLENHNKFNETQELIEHYTDISCVSIEVEDNIKRNRNSKIKSIPGTICSIRGCSNISTHPIPLDECKKLKQIFSLFDFSHIFLIESKNKTEQMNFPLSICDKHIHLINGILTCQLCCNKLDINCLDSTNWKLYKKWNLTLLQYDIPLKLVPGMFICSSCQTSVSEDSFSISELKILQQNVKRRNNDRLQLFGTSQNIISDSKISIESHSKSESKIKFADPLISSTRYFTPDSNKHAKISNPSSKDIFSSTVRDHFESNVINVETVNSNKSNRDSLMPVESLTRSIDSKEIRKRLRDFVIQRIEKKQKLGISVEKTKTVENS